MGYKKYAKDYKPQLVSVNDGRGMKEIYVYKGPYFAAHFPSERGKKRAKRLSLCAAVACCLLFVAAGLIDSEAARKVYIAIPFVVEMAPAAFFLLGAVLQWRAPEQMKREEVDRSWRRVSQMGTLLGILAGVVCLESLGYMLIAGAFSAPSLIFALLNGLTGLSAGYIAIFMRKNCTIVEEKSSKNSENT